MTTYYKSIRYIDGKAKWVIEEENGDINKNPTKEQLKSAILDDLERTKYKNRECYICHKTGNFTDVPYNYYEGNWDAKSYICRSCYVVDYYGKYEKYIADFRNKNLDPKSSSGKGFIFEQIVNNTLGIENCNIRLDNFHSHFDGSQHQEFGMIQSKGTILFYGIYKGFIWSFNTSDIKDCDTVFLICMDIEMKNVDRVYRIAVDYIDVMTIYRSSKRSKWEKFRIDEKPFNDTFHNMKLSDCSE